MVILKIGVWGYTGSEAIFAATLDGIMDVVSQTLNFAVGRARACRIDEVRDT